MPSTIGAKEIETRYFSCIIREISVDCKIRKKKIHSVLFTNTGSVSTFKAQQPEDNTQSVGMLHIYARNDYGQFFFISNNIGENLNLRILREDNNCFNEDHHRFSVYGPDFPDNDESLRSDTYGIEQGIVKAYYYDLFKRGKNWSVASTRKVAEYSQSGALMKSSQMAAAFGLGYVAGNFTDFICILRFIGLPEIKSGDDNECIYDFQFNDCCYSPTFFISVYPDVEFHAEIGIGGYERDLYKQDSSNNRKIQTTKSSQFSFELKVKYSDIENKFNFESFSEIEKGMKNNALYKTLKSLGQFFNATANFAEHLQAEIEGGGSMDNSIAQDVGKVGQFVGKTGSALMRHATWLKGCLSITPKLSGTWYYETSNDLRTLKRHLEIALNAECMGKLTIDLVEISVSGFRKAKKYTALAAATASIVSGGLAALPSALITLLINTVVTWLINQAKEGVKCDLVFIGRVELSSFSYNTSEELPVKGLTIKVNPEIRLEIGVEVKSTISFFIIANTAKAGANAEAATALTWTLSLNEKDSNLGFDHEVVINPFGIKVEAYVSDNFEICISKAQRTKRRTNGEAGSWGKSWDKSVSNEWLFEEIKCAPERWVLFDWGNKKEGDN